MATESEQAPGSPRPASAKNLASLPRRYGDMSNSVVLITGALTGIGRAAALAFAKEGARLVVSGRHDDAGTALAAELRGMGAEAEFIRADVRHEDEVQSLVDR